MSESLSFLIKNEGIQMEPCETILQQPPPPTPKSFEANQLPQIPLVCFVLKIRKVGIKPLNNALVG